MVSERVRALLEQQCWPSRSRTELLTQLPANSSTTQPFLWKDVPLHPNLFLHPPPFGIRDHRAKVQDILKQVDVWANPNPCSNPNPHPNPNPTDDVDC